MPLHRNLNNVIHLCRQIVSLSDAEFHLSGNQGRYATGSAARIMYEIARDSLNDEVNTLLERLMVDLKVHRTTHATFMEKFNQNDPSKT